MSINYYNDNAEKYIESTLEVDMSHLYKPFLKHIPKEGKILDIGCGSGRDSHHFKKMGYQVYAHDGSQVMVDHTEKYLGNHVKHCLFEDFDAKKLFGKNLIFDGLWACSSLLHVKEESLAKIIRNYMEYLKIGGVFFLSFKEVEEHYEKDGRWFTNFTQNSLKAFLRQIENLEALEWIITSDVREERKNEGWISVIARKVK